ncbi:ATP-binding cassette domain-containing protein, partial [Candidatus Sodalis sp. SoCistrobi]|uniref:ATP-binding cassette domain-containing protein n=1 Tax=Candidatus Sodalis sp. SoCistrobi TaxID=1922216 RepID=UPI0020B88C13
MTTAPPYLSFRGIGKVFPGVKALDAISFDCYAGQIHALMGENGAGKSTLLKILSGSYTPSQGEILSGSSSALLRRRPLRTVRASFPAYGSSLSITPCKSRFNNGKTT